MKITYKKNGRRKTCEYNSPYAVDKEAASLGVLWHENFRGPSLEPAWTILTNTGKLKDESRTFELVSFEPDELEKKGFFNYSKRKTLNKKCSQGTSRLVRW